jgi:peroxiredoxin family protein
MLLLRRRPTSGSKEYLIHKGLSPPGGRECLDRTVATKRKVAAIVSRADAATVDALVAACQTAALDGEAVRIFFRDESIPSLCRAEVAVSLTGEARQEIIGEKLETLARAGDVRLFACSSSMYLWGMSAADLLPFMAGSRGLIAFLAEDMEDAAEVLSF